MIKNCLFIVFTCLTIAGLQAQSTAGLVRYFSFDNCDGEDNGNAGVDATLLNGPQCGCGVSGTGLEMDGLDDAVIIPGTESLFNTNDFTVSFYYKSTSGASQDIISRQGFCNNDHAFSIRIIPSSNTIISKLRENNGKGTLWNTQLDLTNCWHHVVFVRKAEFHSLYLDGVLVEEQSTVSRTDISNDDIQMGISTGPCLGIQDLPFQGTIDELRIYNRAVNESEIADLTVAVDQILTQDTLIFLGNSVDIQSSPSCAASFGWSPSQGVDDVSDPNTTLSPSETTVYTLSSSQGFCSARDSIRVSVIDPAALDCTQLFMANAFTPNGDGKNDTYGISNPFALEEFISFEILDKWGDRVFFTSEKFTKWNGTYQGSELTAGVYLYRVFYRCSGEEQVRTGSVTMIR